jgi:hypothetical protein
MMGIIKKYPIFLIDKRFGPFIMHILDFYLLKTASSFIIPSSGEYLKQNRFCTKILKDS